MVVDKLLKDLNVSRILFIDDQLELNDDEKVFQLQLYLAKEKENQELRHSLATKLSEEEMEMIFEREEFDFLYEEDEKRDVILQIVDRTDPEVLKGHAKHIEEKLIEYFGGDMIESSSNPSEVDFNKYDLIIMDYNYSKGEFTALDILKRKELNGAKLKYIVFISSHSEFEYENTSYKMIDSESRQDLFRRYSSNNFLEFKALLNFISKDSVVSKDAFFASLYETLLELESGKLMFASLFSMKKLLDKGVNDAISKLLLTNSKTMKALITEKLETEGISETSYLIDFSLALVRNLITNSVSQMKDIHENLTNIQGWSCEIWDYETDNHLRDLRRIELLDENVNMRNNPIDFGDIFQFEINDSVVKGILISQSCDLIIREIDGNIQRNAKVATIILEGTKKAGKGCVNLRLGAEEIVFDVRRKILIPSWILDFTSLDSQYGKANFKINQSTDREFTWGNFFHKYITNLVNEKSDELKELSNGLHTNWSENIAFTFIKDEDVIDYQISRIGRLDYLNSLSILKQKTDLDTRVPLSLDLSNEEMKYSLLETELNSRETDLEFYYNEKDKFVLADAKDIINVLQNEGFEINKEVIDKIITEISTSHRESIILSEQFKGKRMLIINEETAKTFSNNGIVIQTNKKKKSVKVTCRFNQLTSKAVCK